MYHEHLLLKLNKQAINQIFTNTGADKFTLCFNLDILRINVIHLVLHFLDNMNIYNIFNYFNLSKHTPRLKCNTMMYKSGALYAPFGKHSQVTLHSLQVQVLIACNVWHKLVVEK